MSYKLHWKTANLAGTSKAAEIDVPVGQVVSDKASIRFTGKGAPGYGVVQQENLMHMLENFADSVEPLYPTVGQEWFDTSENTLRVCVAIRNGKAVWRSLAGIQITDTPPNPAALGDIWFQRTGPDAGILYLYTGTGRFPTTPDATTIGGWHQMWPMIDTVAGREEYDSIYSLVTELIDPVTLNNVVPGLPNFAALDADLRTKAANPNNGELKIDTISWDWDMLLAAARYAISRLDLPAGMIDDISTVPFVTDGRPAAAPLLILPTSDIRYPSLDRRSNRRFGMVTLVRAFAETANVLKAAIANRYSIKGINGSTGTNPTFAPTTETVNHASFTGSPAGANTETITMRFNFASPTAMQTFLNSGGAIQVSMSHTGTATPDAELRDLFSSRGVIRITADKTRVFSGAVSPTLAVPAIPLGLKDAPANAYILTTQTLGGASVSVSAATNTPTQLLLTITANSTGALNGASLFNFHVIRDTTTYNAPAVTRVFGAPNAFAPADKSGSAFLR